MSPSLAPTSLLGLATAAPAATAGQPTAGQPAAGTDGCASVDPRMLDTGPPGSLGPPGEGASPPTDGFASVLSDQVARTALAEGQKDSAPKTSGRKEKTDGAGAPAGDAPVPDAPVANDSRPDGAQAPVGVQMQAEAVAVPAAQPHAPSAPAPASTPAPPSGPGPDLAPSDRRTSIAGVAGQPAVAAAATTSVLSTIAASRDNAQIPAPAQTSATPVAQAPVAQAPTTRTPTTQAPTTPSSTTDLPTAAAPGAGHTALSAAPAASPTPPSTTAGAGDQPLRDGTPHDPSAATATPSPRPDGSATVAPSAPAATSVSTAPKAAAPAAAQHTVARAAAAVSATPGSVVNVQTSAPTVVPLTTARPLGSTPPVAYGVRLEQAAETVRATIAMAARQGSSTARIQLAPESLGGLQIHLTKTADGLVARVIADHSAAAQTLAQNGDDLRRSLESHGMTLLRLDIESGDHREPSAHGQTDDASNGRGNTARDADDGAVESTNETATTHTSIHDLSGTALVNVLA